MKAILPLVVIVVFSSFPPTVRPVGAAAPPATFPAPASAPVVSADELPRVKPTEPADSAAAFSVRPGFEAQLVSAEPDVIDPIALCFDSDGRNVPSPRCGDYSERLEREASVRIPMAPRTPNGYGSVSKKPNRLSGKNPPLGLMAVILSFKPRSCLFRSRHLELSIFA